MKGFTLVEMMIVVVVVGILAAIALPSYQDQMNKSRRSDAKAALLGLQLALEKFRGSCASFPSAIDTADDCAAGEIKYATTSTDGYYNLSIVAASSTGNSYKIEADPTGAQAGDSGCDPMSLTVNNANPKGLREPAECW